MVGARSDGEGASCGVKDHGGDFSSELSDHLSYFRVFLSSHLFFPLYGHFTSPAAKSNTLLPAAVSESGADPFS